MSFTMYLYGTICGLGYLAFSACLGVTSVFLFVTLVSAISELVEEHLGGGDAGAVAPVPRVG